MFYTGVTVRALLGHLERGSTGLDHPSGVEIILSLHQIWDFDPCVFQFIIAMEEAQQKLVRAKLSILNNALAAFMTLMLLRTDSFPRNCLTWDGKTIKDQTSLA